MRNGDFNAPGEGACGLDYKMHRAMYLCNICVYTVDEDGETGNTLSLEGTGPKT
jgi:hypothetical protein